ncbi:hypothetical protein D3C73_1225860 [compost metagenome]
MNPATSMKAKLVDRPSPASAASMPMYAMNTARRAWPLSIIRPVRNEPAAPPRLNRICTVPACGRLKPCPISNDGNQLSSMYNTVRVKKHATHSSRVRLACPGPNSWASIPWPATFSPV